MGKNSVKKQKQGKRKGRGFLLFLCFLAFVVAPVCIANFVPGGDEFLQGAIPYVVSFIIALIITMILHGKHFTVSENQDADDYIDPSGVEITYKYDKYTHTS